jgi:hypothetical protein
MVHAAAAGGRESLSAPEFRFADVTDAQWAALAARRIFFGHQSVGANIMDGVTAVLAARPDIPLRIVDNPMIDPLPATGIYHARIGTNRDPASKADAFAALVDGLRPDVALFKYCYVDVAPDTDAHALFEDYRRRIRELRSRHPDLLVGHVTMPLTAYESWKSLFKARLRRKVTQRDFGVIRNRYNRLLLQAYAGEEPVFDLARLESTRRDGSRVFFKRADQYVYGLDPTFSDDGAHLDTASRMRIAESFLAFLARLPHT